MFIIRLRFIKAIGLSIWLLLLVVGCQPVTNNGLEIGFADAVQVTEEARSSLSAASPTATHSVSQAVTSTVTSIPSPTNSPIPQPSPTSLPTETVTPIPWPTLPPEEAANKVLSLLADNQNPDCLLPCWWGAIPGQTPWQDVEPFLSSFATKINETPIGASVKLPIPEPAAVSGFGYYVSYGWDESRIIRGISVTSMNIVGYDAKTMVNLYGVPDEVWLKTLDAPREGVLPFQLIIVYQQQGISFRYYVNASTDGETITACFEPGIVELERPDLFPVGPTIRVWEPGQHKTIDEIANIPGEIYFPLAEKTDLTPQTLYEKYTNPDEPPCIDTPADAWRGY